MGYTTKFSGAIKLSRPLTMTEAKELLEINENPDLARAPKPDSYMQWVPSQTLDHIVWDGGEKFYDYTAWMQWLCLLLGAWGIEADGQLYWQGDGTGDTGRIDVSANTVAATSTKQANSGYHKPLTLEKLREIALDQVVGTLKE